MTAAATTEGLRLLESRVLRWSMVATAVLAAAGVAGGIVSSSQIVLFDGMWGILGIGLTWLSMRASDLVAAGPTPRYPFGREALAPLVIAIQSIALLGTGTYAVITAIQTIASGGSDVAADAALVYGVVTLLAAGGVWLWLRAVGRPSELLRSEAVQWRAGAGLSLGMVVAFVAAIVLEGGRFDDVARYVDPALVIVACVFLLPTPIRMLRDTVVELLEGAPAPEIQEPVRRAIAEVRAQFDLQEPYIRMTKVGRKLYVEVDFVVPGRDWDVADEDEIRYALRDRIVHLPYQLWLNVELSGDPDWVA